MGQFVFKGKVEVAAAKEAFDAKTPIEILGANFLITALEVLKSETLCEGIATFSQIVPLAPAPVVPADTFTTQRAEFDSCANLCDALQSMPPIVDDDYPEYRHAYEGALRGFLAACAANGREFPK